MTFLLNTKTSLIMGLGPMIMIIFKFFFYNVLSYDVAVFQWITSCHKNHMTTPVITLLQEYVMSLTTSVTTM